MLMIICLGVAVIVLAAVAVGVRLPGLGVMVIMAMVVVVGIVNSIVLGMNRWRNIQGLAKLGQEYQVGGAQKGPKRGSSGKAPVS
jgi:hypothetical protein